jgi:hypothetical protein
MMHKRMFKGPHHISQDLSVLSEMYKAKRQSSKLEERKVKLVPISDAVVLMMFFLFAFCFYTEVKLE